MEDEMKLKQKLIMDGIMMILLLVLMNYDLAGGLIHEFLGIVILVGSSFMLLQTEDTMLR